MRVVEEIFMIVPVHKLVLQRWQEGSEGEKDNQQWRKPADPSLRRSEDHRAIAPRTRLHGGLDLELTRRTLAAHCLLHGASSPARPASKKQPLSVPRPI